MLPNHNIGLIGGRNEYNMKKMTARRLALLLCFASLLGTATAQWCVQVGPFENESNKNANREKLSRKSLKASNSNDGFLYCGPFTRCVDAVYAADLLREENGTPVRVAKSPKEMGQKSEAVLPNVFSPKVDGQLARQLDALPDNDSVSSEICGLLREGRKAEGHAALEKIMQTASNADPLKGWAYTKRGIEALVDGDYELAEKHLRVAAEARVGVTRQDQFRAMRRVAWILHHQGKKGEAWKAYDEAEAFASKPETKAYAIVEKCGIEMELARSAKGTLADCRNSYAEALKKVPEKCARQRGTIELMNLETWYYERQYDVTVKLADAWLARYPDQVRDKSMCLFMRASALHYLGRAVEAEESLMAVLDIPETGNPWDSFGAKGEAWDMKERALSTLKEFASARGDAKMAAFWQERLQEYRTSRR